MKKYYILLAILFILLIVTVVIILSGKTLLPQTTPVQIFKITPKPSLTLNQINPELKTIIGQTNDEIVRTLPNIKNVTILSDGAIKYSLKSSLIARDDEIITKNNKVIFERIVEIDKNNKTISHYKQVLGEPENTIVGSDYYGIRAATYIFAGKGIALIGDTFSDKVYETQVFTPTIPEEYIRLWGADIKPFKGEYPKP